MDREYMYVFEITPSGENAIEEYLSGKDNLSNIDHMVLMAAINDELHSKYFSSKFGYHGNESIARMIKKGWIVANPVIYDERYGIIENLDDVSGSRY